jgi:PKD repeat protein
MKKILFLTIFITLLCNFSFSQDWIYLDNSNKAKAEFNLNEDKSTKTNLNISFTINAYRLQAVNVNQQTSYIVDAPDAAKILKAGAPDLPLYAKSIIIPDTGAMEVVINKTNYIEIQNINIAPSKGNLLRTVNPDSVPYFYGPEYQLNNFFPTDIVYLRDPYILRDFRGQAIVIQPFQYNPSTKTLRIYTSIDITVRATQDTGINVLHRNKALKSIDSEFMEIYKRQFLNFNSSLKYTPLNDDPGRMLIISYSSFMSAMQPFVDWKIMKGIPCEIVDVSTIGNNATSIKNYVTNYYNTKGLTYLLLVGDFAQVTSPTANFSGVTGAKDNQYAYITGNDHYQEFFVGRFSAETVEDVQTQVTRSINYEKNPTTGTWLEGTLGIASDQGPGDDNEYDYAHIRNILTDLLNYNYNTKYELYDGSQGGQDAPGNPSATNVSTVVNNGVGNIFYCGHGADTYWVTTSFSNAKVNELTNYNKLPFIYSVACVVGHFNAGTCFCEAWMRANKTSGPTGAIGIFGSTINQSWNPPQEAQDEMVDILVESYTSNIKRTFSGIAINGCFKMNDTYQDYDMTDTWTVFGDPSIVLRTKNPMTMTVSHPTSISTGTSNINVTCNVNGAYVSITLNNQILGTGYVSNGTANITLTPAPANSGDTLRVCVTAYNYIPYIGNIVVTGNSTNPQNFSATAISESQIDLSWYLNSSNNLVLLVYNTTNTFGTPTSGTSYTVGQTINGGGTIIYQGSNSSFSHTGLNANTTYYYKIFSILSGNTYSTGVTTQATTLPTQVSGFSLDFEACTDWSTDFTPWTSYDGDAKNTYGSTDCDFTGEGTAFGFMAFNPSLAGCFSTHGGQRCGVSICPADGSESNDWIISPQLQMNNNGYISFWVYSPKPGTWGNETYDVLVSTTNNQPSSFTAIATAEVAPSTWTQKTYSLSAYNNQQIYVAIRHRATDKFMMLIDDIELNSGTASTPTASFIYSPSNICQGSPVQFTNTSQNATSYSWSFPGGNPATSTQTNPIVTFNTTGNYTISLTAYNGSFSNTYTQSITIYASPNVTISANPTNICSGSSATLTASGASSYTWSNGLGSSNPVTVYPTTSTTYNVTGTSNGCTASTSAYINVFSTPQAPTISIINNNPIILQSSEASGNQWYKDSNPISGAIYQTYQVVENGTYYAKLFANGCTSDPSNSIYINTININDYNSDDITIYPNPAQDIIYIQTNYNILEVLLYDNLGKLIINNNEPQLNVESISNGVYHLIIRLQDRIISLPVMIKK